MPPMRLFSDSKCFHFKRQSFNQKRGEESLREMYEVRNCQDKRCVYFLQKALPSGVFAHRYEHAVIDCLNITNCDRLFS